MSYPINYPTPQNCNVQTFYGSQRTWASGGVNITLTWVKPKGVSFVWFTLIGAGGAGGDSDEVDNQCGGGSGAVTNCLMPAFLVPDQLRVFLPSTGITSIVYQGQNAATGYTLLTANAGGVGGVSAGAAGQSSSKTAFGSAGLYQSITGQGGTPVATTQSPSPTTFLSGGTGYLSSTNQPNYGYPSVPFASDPRVQGGYFQLSPIIVGAGGSSSATNGYGTPGGIGCGGGGASVSASPTLGSGGKGGAGMAVIISW